MFAGSMMLALALAATPLEEAIALEEYLRSTPNTDPGYERREYELAKALRALGLDVAAAEYFFNVAQNRTNPELLADALAAIRELMAGPHDEALLDHTLIAESELGRFPSELDSFISFTKGLEDLRAHRIEWAERHFARIDDATIHRAKALYVLGVQRLRRGETAGAVALLKRALAHPAADRELRNQARLALARILFEAQKYAAALDLYGRMEGDELDPTLYLEKAWTHYHLGELEAAMGALHALEAPAFRGQHAPEIFLLRALIHRDLCGYVQAKRVIRTFQRRFEDTLRTIHTRAELAADPVLFAAARERGPLARLERFRAMIAAEAGALDGFEGAEALRAHLAKLYALKTQGVELRIGALFEEQLAEIAEELIDFEEQMQLLDYELGLAIHQRARAPADGREVEVEPRGPAGTVTFELGDEFWNDELDRYRFVAVDRCVRRGGAR